jgi:hypothetical protein
LDASAIISGVESGIPKNWWIQFWVIGAGLVARNVYPVHIEVARVLKKGFLGKEALNECCHVAGVLSQLTGSVPIPENGDVHTISGISIVPNGGDRFTPRSGSGRDEEHRETKDTRRHEVHRGQPHTQNRSGQAKCTEWV